MLSMALEMFTQPVFTALRYAKHGICRRCVSVCRLRYCIKMDKRRIMQIMPHDSPGTLVFCH